MFNYRTTKFKIYPTQKQKDFIDTNVVLCRKMFNMLLRKHYKLYDEYSKFRERENLSKEVAQKLFFASHKRPNVATLKKKDDKFTQADSLALEYEQLNVKMAFKNYFNTECKTPKFKKGKDTDSYTTRNVNDNIRINDEYIRLPKIGRIKAKGIYEDYCNMHICLAKVISEKNGKYYIHITFREETVEATSDPLINNDYSNVVGLDFKVGSIFTSSDNFTPQYISTYFKYLNRLKKMQGILKGREYLSKSWYHLVNKIRNLHKKIANYRKDFQHKLSSYLCNHYDYIVIESLKLKDIAKKLKNGTNTYDTSYGLFTEKLTYKAKGKVIKVNKWFPSSKKCSNCGKKKRRLKLSQRIYRCNKCGHVMDRDLNAAINIKSEGIRIIKKGMQT